MRTKLIVALAALLTGCSGMATAWRFQMDMQYLTPQEKPADQPQAGRKS